MDSSPDETFIGFSVQHTIKPILNVIKDEQQYRQSVSSMLAKKNSSKNGGN